MKNVNKLLACALVLMSGLSFGYGTVSDGGGGTVPADRAPESEIQQALMAGRRTLTLMFNYLAKPWVLKKNQEEFPMLREMVSSDPNIFNVIESSYVRAQPGDRCFDPQGKEVDGSASVSRNEICIDIERLSQKLTRENYVSQTIALMAHEYVHLLGFGEKEAEEIQKLASIVLIGAEPQSADSNILTFKYEMQQANEALEYIKDSSTAELRCFVLGNALKLDPVSGPFSVLNPAASNKYLVWQSKVLAAWAEACSQGAPSEKIRKEAQDMYETIFQNDLEVTAKELHIRAFRQMFEFPEGIFDSVDGDLTVRKITNSETLALEINDMIELGKFMEDQIKLYDDMYGVVPPPNAQ